MDIAAWAALEAQELLVPFKATSSPQAPLDDLLHITHGGGRHSDLHPINADWPALSFRAAGFGAVQARQCGVSGCRP